MGWRPSMRATELNSRGRSRQVIITWRTQWWKSSRLSASCSSATAYSTMKMKENASTISSSTPILHRLWRNKPSCPPRHSIRFSSRNQNLWIPKAARKELHQRHLNWGQVLVKMPWISTQRTWHKWRGLRLSWRKMVKRQHQVQLLEIGWTIRP